MRIAITGATGFIGNALTRRLATDSSHSITAVGRTQEFNVSHNIKLELVQNIDRNSIWDKVLNDIDLVVHAAARAHVMNDTSSNPLLEFREINTLGTLNLARQAAQRGVKRFVFISSIGVNGRQSSRPFTEKDMPCPVEPYAISKFEAERGLLKIARETGLEIVIIRPPLVYGPNAPGNFRSLLHWLNKRIPLPLGAVHNKRSFVALDNLVDFIITCIDHPSAANEVFLISDDEDMSTAELLERTGAAMGKPAYLISVPTILLGAVACLLGKKDVAKRLLGSLQVNITKAKEILGWSPQVSVDEGLRRTAEAFLQSEK